MDPSLSLDFESWKPESKAYANVDAELRVKLTTLHFFGNRPTIGALMGIGKDLSLAFKAGQRGSQIADTQPSDATAEDSTTEDSDPSSDNTSGCQSCPCWTLLVLQAVLKTRDLTLSETLTHPHPCPCSQRPQSLIF